MAKRGRPPHPDILTPREWEVLTLLREGLSNEQIAERLGVGVRTARYHVSEILSKLGVRSRKEAANWPAAGEQRPWWATAVAPIGFVWRKIAAPAPGGLSTAAMAVSIVLFVGLLGGLGFIGFLLAWSWAGEDESHTEVGVGEANVAETLSDAEQSDPAQASLDDTLKGPDAIIGIGDSWGHREGTEPEQLVRNVPLVVVATVTQAEIIKRPIKIDASKLDWPTPAPGQDAKGGSPTGVIEVGGYTTRYLLDVEEFVKTDVDGGPSFVNVVAGGATANGKELAYSNTPFLRVGERYLLLLMPHSWVEANDDDYFPGSSDLGVFLLKDGQAYGAPREGGRWAPFEVIDEAELLQYLRDEVRRLSAGAE